MSNEKKFPSGKIINPLLTKLFQSRWLDIGLVHFLRTYCMSQHKQSSIDQAWLVKMTGYWRHLLFACLWTLTTSLYPPTWSIYNPYMYITRTCIVALNITSYNCVVPENIHTPSEGFFSKFSTALEILVKLGTFL